MTSTIMHDPRFRPVTIADVQEAVKVHSNVVPVGAGYSWNRVRQQLPKRMDYKAAVFESGVLLCRVAIQRQSDKCQYRHDDDTATDH